MALAASGGGKIRVTAVLSSPLRLQVPLPLPLPFLHLLHPLLQALARLLPNPSPSPPPPAGDEVCDAHWLSLQTEEAQAHYICEGGDADKDTCEAAGCCYDNTDDSRPACFKKRKYILEVENLKVTGVQAKFEENFTCSALNGNDGLSLYDGGKLQYDCESDKWMEITVEVPELSQYVRMGELSFTHSAGDIDKVKVQACVGNKCKKAMVCKAGEHYTDSFDTPIMCNFLNKKSKSKKIAGETFIVSIHSPSLSEVLITDIGLYTEDIIPGDTCNFYKMKKTTVQGKTPYASYTPEQGMERTDVLEHCKDTCISELNCKAFTIEFSSDVCSFYGDKMEDLQASTVSENGFALYFFECQDVVECETHITPGADIHAGEFIQSGLVTAIMEKTGNFALMHDGKTVWSTGTTGADNTLSFTENANVAIYDSGLNVLWETSTGYKDDEIWDSCSSSYSGASCTFPYYVGESKTTEGCQDPVTYNCNPYNCNCYNQEYDCWCFGGCCSSRTVCSTCWNSCTTTYYRGSCVLDAEKAAEQATFGLNTIGNLELMNGPQGETPNAVWSANAPYYEFGHGDCVKMRQDGNPYYEHEKNGQDFLLAEPEAESEAKASKSDKYPGGGVFLVAGVGAMVAVAILAVVVVRRRSVAESSVSRPYKTVFEEI
ncbi:hypothetical protein CYMTET_39963 [Cymbomonas tetramitiformis]|uniref:Apple domain-containing protein n=1 Tax=Cymbomonas tetramitiformis TaxID=36881 RepID=A0AAE0CB37_9CHLO|nr:hypothetical protein CYMTET_39963 [Cymbomonas tetramitiformis]